MSFCFKVISNFWNVYEIVISRIINQTFLSGHLRPLFIIIILSTQFFIQLLVKKYRKLDSNLRSLVPETTALPTKPQPLPQIQDFWCRKYSHSNKWPWGFLITWGNLLNEVLWTDKTFELEISVFSRMNSIEPKFTELHFVYSMFSYQWF